jgi:hypothetical protein
VERCPSCGGQVASCECDFVGDAEGADAADDGSGEGHPDAAPRRYPKPKWRDLTSSEKAHLRARIEAGDSDIYALAAEFGCSSSQVAGIKAAMHR